MKSIIAQLRNYNNIYHKFNCRVGLYLPESILHFDLRWLKEFVTADMILITESDILEVSINAHTSYASNDLAWMDAVDVIIPIHTRAYGAPLIDDLRRLIQHYGKTVTVNDQISCEHQIHEGTNPITVMFRGMQLSISPGTVLPFHYVNDPFINYILHDLVAPPLSLIELCSGSGCIGLALTREIQSINQATLVDLSPYAIDTAQTNIRALTPTGGNVSIEAVQSVGFDELDPHLQFDLIVANPPHRNKAAKRIQDYGGADVDWGFHRNFITDLHMRLTEHGSAYLLENGREGFVPETQLIKFIEKFASETFNLETTAIAGSEFYIAKLTNL